MKRVTGLAEPSMRPKKPGLFLGSRSSTLKPRSRDSISERAAPAGPVSLLRTPSSMFSEIEVTCSCARAPKKMTELLSLMLSSANALSTRAFISASASL
jgi:hypothetical protein